MRVYRPLVRSRITPVLRQVKPRNSQAASRHISPLSSLTYRSPLAKQPFLIGIDLCAVTSVAARSLSATSARASVDDDENLNLKPDDISLNDYHAVADETLENILEHCEDLADTEPKIDVELAQGVLTLILPPHGTYVINKQPPNKQIWLSSPISGPKRYDLIDSQWTDHRDGTTLGYLLRQEISEALGVEATFNGVDDYSR
ncbi:hypothetical protein POJ06DRAFT_52173 [Lipomyces tetrasporus]|uniref:ferroxidase n=1 Tax=Lipomyces tetrasporus TaxID=54092 RepID=A0AAD7QW91_9ASCO|nr:uncharacterized protein POJ06DRAFT_52173 [Lipomyces tetrasporus]KAJ8102599.1 hypothetical protein POJ06DRAFT_52173 [Lipomyces tetrasporus]